MRAFNVGFVIFPQLTQLDFTGPLQVLHRVPQSKVHYEQAREAFRAAAQHLRLADAPA